MKKVFCSLLAVLMVLALFVSCSDVKAPVLKVQLDAEDEFEWDELDFDHVYIDLYQYAVPKEAYPNYCMEIEGDDVAGITEDNYDSKNHVLTLTCIPAGTYEYFGINFGDTGFSYDEEDGEFTLTAGKTTTITVSCSRE